MKVVIALVVILALGAGFVLANVQRADPGQPTQKPLYNAMYTYSGEKTRLKESGFKDHLVSKVEVGLVDSTIVGMPSKGGSCQLVTTYKGGRITYQDGTTKECQKVTFEGLAGYPSSYVGCTQP